MIGNPIPDIIYGINMGMAWKGFDLNLQFGGTIGNQIFNAMRYYTYFPNDITNKDTFPACISRAPANTSLRAKKRPI